MNKTVVYQSFAPKMNDGQIVMDIASALLCEECEDYFLEEILQKLKIKNTTLYIPATPSVLGTGDVASNFRYKHDMTINNNVVERWLQVFEAYHTNTNPVVVTSVGRDARYMTFKLLEDGYVNVVNNRNENSILEDETKIFNNFVKSFGITPENMIKIRESSKGARYNTYMADMIGFVNILNYNYNPEMFQRYDLEAQMVTPECKFYRKEVEGEYMLQPVVKNGKEWIPKEGYNYLYFSENIDKSKNNTFMMLDEKYMPQVYSKLFEMLTPEDNVTKSKVRGFLKSIMSYDRLSDYWYNDIDDPFTIFMIQNCYKYCKLDDLDRSILTSFEIQTRQWLDEM